MATFVARNAHFRAIARRFSSYALKQLSSTSAPSPAIDFVRGMSSSFPVYRSAARSTLIGALCVGNHGMRPQSMCLCSAAGVAPSSDSKAQRAEKVEEDKSKGGEKSGESGNSGSQQSGEAGREVRGGPVSWLSFLLLAITGAGIIWYYDNEKKRHIEEINAASTAVKQGPSVGKAAIGGPFSLINHEGKRVTDKDFRGNWTLIYFGFTHCPDICPAELEKLAAAIDKIKAKSGLDITPVFISVDPERDTPEQVGEYVKEFHPKIIGLTGTPSEIKDVARAYRVYFMKTNEEDDDYLVDHSIIMYLMGPDMDFVKFYGKNNDVDALTDGIINEIKKYKPQK
uniref:Thioredoxin domain-containing protein n=1 Tax=Kalanchoe fedtschenkoi TaxID=63787 RepID=A0A7N0T6K9_KALFE